MHSKQVQLNKLFKKIKSSAKEIKNFDINEFDIYSEEAINNMLEDDELTLEEAWFMKGWEHAFDRINN